MKRNVFIKNNIYSLSKTSNLYNSIFSKAAYRIGLSKPEADVLIFLANNSQYNTARDISLHRGFSKSYISKAIDPLLEKKLIIIKSADSDKRYQYLYLTEKSNDIVKSLREAQDRYFEILTENISTEDLNTYLSVLNRFADNANEALKNLK